MSKPNWKVDVHAPFADITRMLGSIDNLNSNNRKAWYAVMRGYLYSIRNAGYSNLPPFNPLGRTFEAHHALITRAQCHASTYAAPLIDSEYNMLLLTNEEHQNPPTRDEAFWLLADIYGADTIRQWYIRVSLQFMAVPLPSLPTGKEF